MDCESQLQLQQQYRITEFGHSAEFPRIPWNSVETWKFRGNGQIPRLGSKLWSLIIIINCYAREHSFHMPVVSAAVVKTHHRFHRRLWNQALVLHPHPLHSPAWWIHQCCDIRHKKQPVNLFYIRTSMLIAQCHWSGHVVSCWSLRKPTQDAYDYGLSCHQLPNKKF